MKRLPALVIEDTWTGDDYLTDHKFGVVNSASGTLITYYFRGAAFEKNTYLADSDPGACTGRYVDCRSAFHRERLA